MPTVRVRFAPSPTGNLHIGGLRTCLFNWLWARKNRGTFILRIEDTDQTRLVPGAVENIIEAMRWYGLNIDEGPIYQSQRTELYRRHADQLLEQGSAYYCFCTPERLTEIRKVQTANRLPTRYDGHCRSLDAGAVAEKLQQKVPHVIRLKVPATGATTFDDQIYGTITVNNSEIDDQVLIKSDGFPTYHLANVVDDHLMEITDVIRAEEWLPSTPKHVLLYQAFGWSAPRFAHLPMVLGTDRSKLSKRHGATAALEYRDLGYLPEAVINFIALLGWNQKNDQEVFTLEQLVQAFDLHTINRASAVFNMEKLDWLNGQYIRTMELDALVKRSKPFLGAYADRENIAAAVSLVRDRLHRLAELEEAVSFFYETELSYDAALLVPKKETPDQVLPALQSAQQALEKIEEKEFTQGTVRRVMEKVIAENKYSNSLSLWPLRVAVTGRAASPGVFEVIGVLGKATTLQRIAAAVVHLKS